MVIYAIDFLIAFVLAVALALLLVPTRRGAGSPSGPVVLFFILLFLPLIWAGGLWLGPLGPPLAEVSWLSFVVVAVFLLLFAFALGSPSGPPRKGSDPVIPEGADEDLAVASAVSFGVFFWLLLLLSIAAMIGYYIRS